jgi:hypothetical protein
MDLKPYYSKITLCITIYQPSKGVAMGSPISSIVSELFLQHFESHIIKHHLENRSLIYNNRYVDDILILVWPNQIHHQQILQQANSIHPNLTFNHTTEDNGIISFLDLSIHRSDTNITIRIYRKLTTIDTVIHKTSNHPQEHKMSALHFLLNRMHTLPFSQHKQKEWSNILHTAKANGYPAPTIIKLNTHIQNRLQHPNTNTLQSNNKKWVTFNFHSPIIWRITNIFRNASLKITFRTNNSLQNILNT